MGGQAKLPGAVAEDVPEVGPMECTENHAPVGVWQLSDSAATFTSRA